MLGFRDKVKLSTHLTDWMNMLGLMDEVTAVQIYTVVTRNKCQLRHTSQTGSICWDFGIRQKHFKLI